MAAALEALIVVALGLALIGYFIFTLMAGGTAATPLLALGTFVAFLAVWGYGLMRTG